MDMSFAKKIKKLKTIFANFSCHFPRPRFNILIPLLDKNIKLLGNVYT